ncbi:hypothetical protein [Niameybacter massiliensis]|uniref:hypothetical protein n=1 Tax=Niameybacter massiliensis TaxID=1658108 RepID=UPI0006B4A8CE|nr:hypothetical protein [Niameybacter massiliensis]
MKNEYIKNTKKKIGEYNKYCTQLELRVKDLDILNENMKFDASNEIVDLNNIKTRTYLEAEIKRLKLDIEKIKKGLNNLNRVEHQIVDLKYIKKNSWINVSMEVGYSVSRCKELGKYGVIQVGEAIYGIVIHQDLPLVMGLGCY